MKHPDPPRLETLPPISARPELVVYFDGGCPLCAKEIAFYQHIDVEKKIQWVNVADENTTCPIGWDRQTLLNRFHVRDEVTGRIHSGADGFARVWCALPGLWRWIGKLAQLPGVNWLMESGYLMTLKIRPWLARRLQQRSRI